MYFDSTINIHNMKQQVVLLLLLLLVVLASCKNEPKQEVYNPFATPEAWFCQTF